MSKKLFYYGSTSSYTARTLAFLAATGISDTTIANALNTMDLALIVNGLDTKMYALYPFVGGTATTHKYNFMNPADTDAAFRITWAGGITHSSTGVLFNGSTGYGLTYFNPVTNLADYTTSGHFSTYLRTTGMATDAPMGFYQNTGQATYVGYKSGGRFYSGWGIAVGVMTYLASSDLGLFMVTRTASNVTKNYQSGVDKLTNASAANAISNNITIGCVWTYNSSGSGGGAIGRASSRESSFATIGSGLNAAENTSLYNIIQAFQTSLSRNV